MPPGIEQEGPATLVRAGTGFTDLLIIGSKTSPGRAPLVERYQWSSRSAHARWSKLAAGWTSRLPWLNRVGSTQAFPGAGVRADLVSGAPLDQRAVVSFCGFVQFKVKVKWANVRTPRSNRRLAAKPRRGVHLTLLRTHIFGRYPEVA